jgi:hypothetical protein
VTATDISGLRDATEAELLIGTVAAARIIGCSPDMLRRLAAKGVIPSLKLNPQRSACRYFRRRVVEALAEGGYEALQDHLRAEHENSTTTNGGTP